MCEQDLHAERLHGALVVVHLGLLQVGLLLQRVAHDGHDERSATLVPSRPSDEMQAKVRR